MDYLTTHTNLLPIGRGFALGFVNSKKGCTRLAVASDKVYQLLVHGRWFSQSTPASSTTKTGCHDIAEKSLKVSLNTENQSINPQILIWLKIFCTFMCVFLICDYKNVINCFRNSSNTVLKHALTWKH